MGMLYCDEILMKGDELWVSFDDYGKCVGNV